jgi:hypothetical protein
VASSNIPHLGETIDNTEIICTCGWTTGFCYSVTELTSKWYDHLADAERQASMNRHPSGKGREW